jgi:hypothetical protein
VERFDVVIVGGRCAGSSLAIRLARRGLRVCVLDRARFPSETPSTHVIQPCGVRILAELGVLDQALAAGAVPIDRFTLVNEDVRIDSVVEPGMFGAPGLCLRRLTLDALLVRAAAAAGAEVRTGCRVRALIIAGERVVGVSSDRGPVYARARAHSGIESLDWPYKENRRRSRRQRGDVAAGQSRRSCQRTRGRHPPPRHRRRHRRTRRNPRPPRVRRRRTPGHPSRSSRRPTPQQHSRPLGPPSHQAPTRRR